MPSQQTILTTRQVLDLIFKDPQTQHSLSAFEDIGKSTDEIISIYPKTATSGRDAGKTKYHLKSFIPFSSGNEEVQVYVQDGKSAPEEIVRQLWVYKLLNQYGYKPDEIALEVGVQFGTEISEKAADIVVYTDNTRDTPKIIVECKKPKRKDGIEQLKSYMNAKGAPVAIWSNGSDSIILYRPYPAQFDDTLFDLPKRGQLPKDVLETKKSLLHLKKDFNFKKIIQDLEELVLADSGKDEFNEIFKLIFAKIWDEKEAQENRKDKTVEFRKALDPEITYDRINKLFRNACEEWPGIFRENEDIELAKRHLQVCVGPIPEEDFYSNKSLVKSHIDAGCAQLHKLFTESGRDPSKLIAGLVDVVEFEGRKELQGRELDVFIGRKVLSNEEVILQLNDTVKHANSHLAIMGKPGVGKTQFLLKILADIRIQSNFQTNFIYFDYKGDVVDNQRFLELAKAQTYRLLQGDQSLPINPFILPDYEDQTVNVSAREKAESFASINSKLGVVQKGALTDAIKAAYVKREVLDLPYPDFQDVLDIVRHDYDAQGKNDDSLVEVLRDLANFNLFWKHGDPTPPFERISNRSMLIDLHKMPVLKELVAYLVIERLYKEMASLPDSPVTNGKRTVRSILVIDEAHNYLAQKNLFLQRIIREGRSKGIVVFFASQSPNDYQQPFFNFQELLEFAFVFQCEGVTANSLQAILGCSAKTAKDLQTEVARLDPFQVITRSDLKTEDFTKFTAEAFFKTY